MWNANMLNADNQSTLILRVVVAKASRLTNFNNPANPTNHTRLEQALSNQRLARHPI